LAQTEENMHNERRTPSPVRIGVLVLACGPVLAACHQTDGFTEDQWAAIQAMEPLKGPVPASKYNARGDDLDLAKFGQMIYFDKDVAEAITVAGPSGNVGDVRKVSCFTCHGTEYGTDSRPFPVSHGRSWINTNTGPLTNLAWYDWTTSSGRFDSMVEHGTTVWGTSATPLAQARFLYLKYKDEYNAVFPDTPLDPRLGIDPSDPSNVYPATGGPKSSPTAADGAYEKMPQDAQDNIAQIRANLGRAFDAYPRQLMTPDSPFQKYVRDRDFSQLTDKAKRGLALFIGKAACNECHNGPNLADNKFHNVGAPALMVQPYTNATVPPNRGRAGSMQAILNNLAALEADPNAVIFNGAGKFSDNRDLGMQRLLEVRKEDQDHCVTRDPNTMACTLYDESLEGAFRTLSLLNCAQSGPYFHSGTVNTLEDVVRQYNAGGAPAGMYVGVVDPKIRPLLLTESEISDLVEFLGTLTGPSPSAQAAADPTAWNWNKNTAKPPLPTGGTSGAMGGTSGGSAGKSGSAGSTGGGMAGSSGAMGGMTGGGMAGAGGAGGGGLGGAAG
jgi:cytochrome c peroxidase